MRVLTLASALAIWLLAAHALAHVSPDLIRSFVRAHVSEIRVCYERSLRTDPRGTGDISLRITIEPSGRVSDVTAVRDTVQMPDMTICILGVVRSWVFPSADPSRGTLTITYPFHFAPAP